MNIWLVLLKNIEEKNIKFIYYLKSSQFSAVFAVLNSWIHWGHEDEEVLIGDQQELEDGGPEWPDILWNRITDFIE